MMDRLESNSAKIIVGLYIVIFSAGAIYYQLEEYSSLNQQDLYPISLGIGVFVSVIVMFYLIKLHHLIFRPKQVM